MIKTITIEEYNAIIDSFDGHSYPLNPGCYIVPHAGCYIAIDNSTNNAWVETFGDFADAEDWLLTDEEADQFKSYIK